MSTLGIVLLCFVAPRGQHGQYDEPELAAFGNRQRSSCAETEDAMDMIEGGFKSCASLDCVGAFALGGPSANVVKLRAKQEV